MQQDNLSDVEKFFYSIQKQLGGNLTWVDLDSQQQQMFTQAVNIILQIGSVKK